MNYTWQRVSYHLLLACIIIFGLVSGWYLVTHLFNHWHRMFRDCPFIKGPLVQMIGDNKTMIFWESCESSGTAKLTWNESIKHSLDGKIMFMKDVGQETTVFHAVIQSHPGLAKFQINIGENRKFYNSQHSVKIPPRNTSLDVRMAVVGDSQMGYQKFQEILPRIKASNPDLFLHLGDMVQTPYKDYDWQTYFFDPLQESGLTSEIPFIITQGNHDVVNNEVTPYFPDPKELHDKASAYYYALTVGHARIIVLDSNREDQAQIKWLDRELQSETSKNAPFRIISVHVPPFIEFWDPKTWEEGESKWPVYVRDKMVPLFEKYKVDIVLSGHQHNYQRGTKNGIQYIIAGGGGGSLDRERVEDFKMYKKTIVEHHFLIIDVTKDRISINMHLLNGTISDDLVINRRV